MLSKTLENKYEKRFILAEIPGGKLCFFRLLPLEETTFVLSTIYLTHYGMKSGDVAIREMVIKPFPFTECII